MLAPIGSGSGLQALVPPGMRAITIEVNEYTGVGAMITPGCRVDVIATLNDPKTDGRIAKTAADMIVPFERFEEMMAIYRDGFASRGLDYAVWGHISDGNVHPNVVPRSYRDIEEGKAIMLELGREVIAMGGSPLAEHGVGRSPLKQALLRMLYGDAGIESMRNVKRALDPEWKLASDVLFEGKSSPYPV